MARKQCIERSISERRCSRSRSDVCSVQLIGNLSRVALNRQLIQLPVVFWFCVGAIPFSILGAWLFTKIPDSKLLNIIGAFLIFTVIWHHWWQHTIASFNPKYFALIGAIFFSHFSNHWQCRPFSCTVLSFLRTCQRGVYRNWGFRNRLNACSWSLVPIKNWAQYPQPHGSMAYPSAQ